MILSWIISLACCHFEVVVPLVPGVMETVFSSSLLILLSSERRSRDGDGIPHPITATSAEKPADPEGGEPIRLSMLTPPPANRLNRGRKIQRIQAPDPELNFLKPSLNLFAL